MIVEFIGCSGAGKTTLMHEVLGCAPVPDSVMTAWDLVIDRPGRRGVTNQTAMNLLADAAALIPFTRSLSTNREFASFSLGRLLKSGPSTFAKFNYARNLIRKIGLHELARRRAGEAAVLADEGTVLIAYQLFVYSRAAYSPADLDRFAQLVPAPDLLIHVKAPIPTLIDRALSRPEPRRELAGIGRQAVAERLHRADEMFDALTATEVLRDRVMTIENTGEPPKGQPSAAEQVVKRIGELTRRRISGEPPRHDPYRRPGAGG